MGILNISLVMAGVVLIIYGVIASLYSSSAHYYSCFDYKKYMTQLTVYSIVIVVGICLVLVGLSTHYAT